MPLYRTEQELIERLRANEAKLIEMTIAPAPGISQKRVESALEVLRGRIAEHEKEKPPCQS
jgi:hypothetical protein